MEKHRGWQFGGIVAVAFLLLVPATPAAAGTLIVDTEYVMKTKDKPGVVLLDARSEADAKKGLIAGAALLDAKGAARALRDVDARILPVKTLEEMLGKAGLTRDNEIIVYGAKGDTGPYVAFWILEYLGATKVRVYHGGIDDWMAAKQPLTNEARKAPATQFVAKVAADRIATTDYVRKSLNSKDVQFIDARTPREYSGEDVRSLRGGHIAAVNSMNIPYEQAWIDPETPKKLADKKVNDRKGMDFKDGAALKALYKDLDPKKEVIAYCQTGTRSAQTYAVLRDMGFQKVRNYDDSWIVYGSNLELPARNVSYYDFVRVNDALRRLEALEKQMAENAARK